MTAQKNSILIFSEEHTDEFELFLSQQEYSKVSDFSGRVLPSNERNRRQKIAQNKIWIEVYINGGRVGCTKKMNLEWPSFEVNFLEKFQIYLFRKPAFIEFRVYMGTLRANRIDTVKIDIPGENANTLTSSSTIYREKAFYKKVPVRTTRLDTRQANTSHDNSRTPIKGQPTEPGVSFIGSKTPGGQPSPIQGNVGDSPSKDIDHKSEEEQQLLKTPISGYVSYKAEWYGFGTSLPPPTIDKMGGKKQDGIRIKNYYEQVLESVVDLNDPRNELAIANLKQLKNKQIQEVLERDAMMPFSDITSLRHQLYKLKFHKSDLVTRKIPLTEEAIFKNADLMNFLTVNIINYSSFKRFRNI